MQERVSISMSHTHKKDFTRFEARILIKDYQNIRMSSPPIGCSYKKHLFDRPEQYIYTKSYETYDYSKYWFERKMKVKEIFFDDLPPPYYMKKQNYEDFCILYYSKMDLKVVFRLLDTVSKEGIKIIFTLPANNGIDRKKRLEPSYELVSLQNNFWTD